jgi:hypothetical protein
MDLAVLKQVLALPEHDRSGSMELAVSRAWTWVRCGTARGEVLGGHARGDEVSRFEKQIVMVRRRAEVPTG